MRKLTKRQRGLTLIEVVVVITIVSMLMTAVAVYAVGALAPTKRPAAAETTPTFRVPP